MKIFFLNLILINFIFASEIDSLKSYNIDEIIITATKSEKNIFEIPRDIKVISLNEIEQNKPKFLPDVFQKISSVHIQKTNCGAGSPIIRGLLGNQILILIDGIRLNNSTFRYGPNQYLNTIDISLVERIEIVEGATSVLFGSDGLGGTINIITKKKNSPISFYSTYSTADKGIYNNLNLSYALDNINFNLGGTYKKFGNLKAGDDSLQLHTNFSGYDANARINYDISDDERISFVYQFANLDKVPRTDKYNENANVVDYKYLFNPQKRNLFYVDYEGSLSFGKLISKIFSHNQFEKREIQKNGKLTIEEDKINNYGVSFDLRKNFSNNNLVFGIDLSQDNIESKRNINNEIKSPQYPNGSKYTSFGIFLQDEVDVERFNFTIGTRYSKFDYRGNTDRDTFNIDENSTSNAFTFSINSLYKVFNEEKNKLNFVFGISQGFRAPNVDDIARLGESGSKYDVPNLNLKPEKNITYEVGFKSSFSDFVFNLFFYFSDFKDMIVPIKSTYNNDTLYNNLRVYQKQNIEKSEIQGISLNSDYNLKPNMSLFMNVNWTYGKNITKDEPLSRIPPLRGNIGIDYFSENYFVKYLFKFTEEQKRLSSSDINDKYRIGPNGTDGYIVDNIYFGYHFDKLELNFSIENLFDVIYKNHGSGVLEAGRNFIFSIKY